MASGVQPAALQRFSHRYDAPSLALSAFPKSFNQFILKQPESPNADSIENHQFRAGQHALTTSDRILYNSAAGELSFDADGSGAGEAVVIAYLEQGLELSARHIRFLA